MKQNYKLAKARSQRFLKAKVRKAKSATISAVRRQYYFNRAYADMRNYISRNEDIYITSLIVTAVLAYAASLSLGQFLLMFFNTAYGLSDVTGINILVLMFAASMVVGVFYLWVASFLMNMMSLPIMDGAGRKTIRSLRKTARASLRLTSRVSATWVTLFGLAAVGPIIAGVVALVFIKSNPLPPEVLLDLIPKAVAASVAWVFIVLMNFGLAPYVALFEPKIGLLQTFKRSYKLVKSRGRIFLLLGYTALTFAIAAAFKLSIAAENILMLNKWVAFSLFILSAGILGNAMAVTLYRKRRLARR